MAKGASYRIAIPTGDNLKVTRDRVAGVMRYIADRRPNWSVRFFPGSQTQSMDSWRRNVVAWKPDGIIDPLSAMAWNTRSTAARIALLPSTCKLVAMQTCTGYSALLPSRCVHVGVDDSCIAEKAFQTLRKKGLEHFAYVHTADPLELARSRLRANTFSRLAKKASCDCTKLGYGEGLSWPRRMAQLADGLSRLSVPCGVMAYNDACAREVMDACALAGLEIPSQIQLTGVDNQEDICELVRPRLTSVVPNFEGVGYLMATRMDELLSGRKARRQSICRDALVVERESTRDLSGAARLVTKAENIIRLHACRGLPPSPKGLTALQIANALKVSRRLLDMRFRKIRAESVGSAIRRRKLEEVKQMLAETDSSIGEISYMCGFPVQTHLNAVFRREFGLTPLEYRRRSKTPAK